MPRTPPRGRQTNPSRNPSNNDAQGPANDGQDSASEGEPDTSRLENITPLGTTSAEEPSLRNVMDLILSLRAELGDCQRQIQDLNAMYIRTNSPLGRDGRDNRSHSPMPTRNPQPERTTRSEPLQHEPLQLDRALRLDTRHRHETAPPRFDPTPRFDTASRHRFDTAQPEEDLYGTQQPHARREYTYTTPNLLREGTVAPENPGPHHRERRMSEYPEEIPPFRPPGDARVTMSAPKTSHKPHNFYGTPLESLSEWIWKMEYYLRAVRTPAEEYFGTAIFYLSGSAGRFAYSLVQRNGGRPPSWEAFKHSMRERYERGKARSDLLRRQLGHLKYKGPSQMLEYCSQFRDIEQQIVDMGFDDRLHYFE
jgi:hypothetical protein